jgi:hypothetical protein
MSNKRKAKEQIQKARLPRFSEWHPPGYNFNGKYTDVIGRFSRNYKGDVGTDTPHLPYNLLDKGAVNHDIMFHAPDQPTHRHANNLYNKFVKKKGVKKDTISYISDNLITTDSVRTLFGEAMKLAIVLQSVYTTSKRLYNRVSNIQNIYDEWKYELDPSVSDLEREIARRTRVVREMKWEDDRKTFNDLFMRNIVRETKALTPQQRRDVERKIKSGIWWSLPKVRTFTQIIFPLLLTGLSGNSLYKMLTGSVSSIKDELTNWYYGRIENMQRAKKVEDEANKVIEKYDKYLEKVGYFEPNTQKFLIYEDVDKENAKKLYIEFYDEWKKYLKFINEEYKDHGYESIPYKIPELNMENLNKSINEFQDKRHSKIEPMSKELTLYVDKSNKIFDSSDKLFNFEVPLDSVKDAYKFLFDTSHSHVATIPPKEELLLLEAPPLLKENDKIISVKDIQDKMVVANYDSVFSYVDGITAQDRRKEMIDIWGEGQKLVQEQGGKDLKAPKWTKGTRGISKETYRKAYNLLQKQLRERNVADKVIEDLDDRADERQMAKVETVIKKASSAKKKKIMNSIQVAESMDEEAIKEVKPEAPPKAEEPKVEPVVDAPFTIEPIRPPKYTPPRFEKPDEPRPVRKSATGNRDNPDNLIDTIRATDAVVNAVLKPSAKDIRKRRANLYDFITPDDQNGGIGTKETNPLVRGDYNRFMNVRRGNLTDIRENHVLSNTNNLKMLQQYDMKEINKRMKSAREAPRKRRGLVRRFPARMPLQRQTREEKKDFQPLINPPSNYAKGSMYSPFFVNRPALPLPYEDYVRLFYGNPNEFFDGADYYNARTNRWL